MLAIGYIVLYMCDLVWRNNYVCLYFTQRINALHTFEICKNYMMIEFYVK